MKTKPMRHQKDGCLLLAANNIFAVGAEQGTGKTWMLLADAEARWLRNEIDAMLVIAPNGVHVNWIAREIPEHLSAPFNATFWHSGASKRHFKTLTKQLSSTDLPEQKKPKTRKLFVHAMNIDAVNTNAGFAFAKAFMSAFPFGRAVIVVDESHFIKNPSAKRTKRVLELGEMAKIKRISSGTLVANSPLDLFSQYEFLRSGLLGTRSYRAFVSAYAVLLSADSGLVQDIMRRTGARGAPQIVAKDKDGMPRFKNLDHLAKLMAPFTFRVTKAECLDLPEKIFEAHYFELSPHQQAIYDAIEAERNWIREDGEMDTFTALTVITKLRQITSGFILEDGKPVSLAESAPRMEALKEVLEMCSGQLIIWASFQEEIAQIAALLKKDCEEFREYHGSTRRADREKAIDDFQKGRARIFLGNPAAAGTGLTLTAAQTAIYYSSSFSLTERLQSEDRCHRIGTKHHVVYFDIVACGTIDERIMKARASKKYTAETILGGL